MRGTSGPAEAVSPQPLDRVLAPLHRWIWRDVARRGRKLLRFAETEADGGRDLARAAELTRDPILRRLYFRHSVDERRHADLFRSRARALLAQRPGGSSLSGIEGNWIAPGERGLDDLRVADHSDQNLLAFLHLSERAAAGRFAVYRDVLAVDPDTQQLFREILRDEAFHMSYTRTQLSRVATFDRRALWRARASRLWRAYLRIAVIVAGWLGSLLLLFQYFLILPLFALLAKRAARREAPGWKAISTRPRTEVARTQY